jgi:5-methyltetrahydrofolate corrinoid/iron sulfur protein methyltransferase
VGFNRTMLIVADNVNILRPEMARAMADMDPVPIIQMVRRCVAAGAQAIDLNLGPLTRAPREKMTFVVQNVRSVTDLPLVLDTVNPVALEAGLSLCSGTAIINGFSLEPDKLDRILPLAGRFDADIIGYVLDAASRVPMTEEAMMSTAVDLFEAYTQAGLPPGRLILDPVVVPATWPDSQRHNRGVLSLIRQLPELLGTPVRTIAGISNLSSGGQSLGAKIILECAYLPMLAAAGLNMALMNIRHRPAVAAVGASRMLLGDIPFCWPDLADAIE